MRRRLRPLVLVFSLISAISAFGLSVAADRIVRVGYVHPQDASSMPLADRQFWERMRELGWIEGKNIVVERRWAEGRIDKLPALMADVVARKVDVLVTVSTPAAVAAGKATSTIPIVVAAMSDPIATGLAVSLARPGRNVTGMSLQMTEGIPGKWLELLQDTVPRLSTVVVIGNPDSPMFGLVHKTISAAAAKRGVKISFIEVRQPDALEPAFAQARKEGDAVVVLSDPLTMQHRPTVVSLAAQFRLPAMYTLLEFMDDDGLMAYATDQVVLFGRAAEYVDKILRGTKPGDLPFEQPTHFKLIVNLKTAKALGITFPQSILLRADEVIR
jgi:putative ABC transport system substrate-binding protein